MNLMTYILLGLTAWTMTSIVVGLGLGAILKQYGTGDGLGRATASEPAPALMKSA